MNKPAKLPLKGTPEYETLRFSREALSDILHLQALPQFVRLMDKLRTQADQLADQVLHGTISSEERENLRLKRIGFLECLKLPEEEIIAHTNVLSSYGMQLGDELPTT